MKSQMEELRAELGGDRPDNTKAMQAQIEYLNQRLRIMERQISRSKASESTPARQTPAEGGRRGVAAPGRNAFEIPNLGGAPPAEPSPREASARMPADPPRVRAPIQVPGVDTKKPPAAEGPQRMALRVITGSGSWGEGAQAGEGAQSERGDGKTSGDGGRASVAAGAARAAAMARPQPRGGLTAREQAERRKKEEEEQKKKVYMPPGALFAGVLLNGADISVSGYLRENPIPVLIRVKRDAILPNYYNLQVRECFALASGYGDLASERAMLRLERLSCVRTDGEVIDAGLEGYVVGDDGKVGLRGRLVNKQGALLARAVAAGVFSGFSDALKPTGVTGINIDPDGTTATTSYDLSTVLEAGAFSGASNAAEKVADYYLDLAEQTLPVIEIDAGREATIVVIKGVSLKLG
jgi:conjugal transfer pilus assembly protein TraB